jgi:hypothetical protein
LCIYTTALEPILAKIADPPPATAKRRPASQKNCPYILEFARAPQKILLKGDQNVLFGSAFNEQTAGRSVQHSESGFCSKEVLTFSRKKRQIALAALRAIFLQASPAFPLKMGVYALIYTRKVKPYFG